MEENQVINISTSEIPCFNYIQQRITKYCNSVQEENIKKISRHYNIPQNDLENLVGLSSINQCRAKIYTGSRCSRKVIKGYQYCGNHLKNLPHGNYV